MSINRKNILILFFSMIILASGMDLLADLSHGADASHIIKEAVLILLAAIGIGWVFADALHQKKQVLQLKNELEQLGKRQAEDYIIEGRQQLAKVIQQQFQQWQLTPGEQEVGLLLLKGLSLKEIAALRDTAEKTVRQQASAIYKKAGVSGRHTFAAWFMEDFL